MSFALDPEKYKNMAFDVVGPAQTLLQMIGEHLNRFNLQGTELTIMDFGSGPGNTATLLADVFPKATVIGVDIDQSMVQYAKDNCTNSRCSFYVQNMSSPYDQWDEVLRKKVTNNVDIIFSSYAIHWVQQMDHLSRNIYQVLKPKTGAFIGNLIYCGNIVTAANNDTESNLIRKCLNYPNEKQYISDWLFAFKELKFSQITLRYTEPRCLFPEQYYKKTFVNIPLKWYKLFAIDNEPELDDTIKELLFRLRIQKTLPSKDHPDEMDIEIYQQLWFIYLVKDDV